jgi:MFS family permease
VILFVLFILWDRGRADPLVPLSLFKDRNFAIGNALAAIVFFGMMGLFLPLTIFLQSVLGFSALKAGLTFAPMSLTSMVIAPIAGRATDRFGGKYILLAGLSCFSVGMGLVIWVSSLSADWSTFLPPLILAGVGLGCTFAPMTTVTMQQVNPRLAGAASGLLNSNRQLGGAFGSAIVGAILQNRLATELVSQAQVQSSNVPAAFRSQFVQGFAKAANGALEVGRGQSGVALPSNLPLEVKSRILQLGHDVFAQAYLNAMRPSLAVAIAVLLLGAVLTTGITGRRQSTVQPIREAAPAAG